MTRDRSEPFTNHPPATQRQIFKMSPITIVM